MKVSQLVASVQRLHMVKSRSKYKASIHHNNEDLKIQWLKLSHEAEELLEKYNNIKFVDTQLIKKYARQEWQLYLKMKGLTNKYKTKIDNLEATLKKIEEVELIDNE